MGLVDDEVVDAEVLEGDAVVGGCLSVVGVPLELGLEPLELDLRAAHGELVGAGLHPPFQLFELAPFEG